MRLLITRIASEAARLAAELGARDHRCAIAPMLEIRRRAGIAIDCSDAQGLLVTSANGVRGLIEATDRRDLTVFAVGDTTARLATVAGFATVHSADGDVGALAELVSRLADPGKGRLIHAAGASLAGDLAGALQARGFAVDRITLYDSVAATSLAPDVAAGLIAGAFDGVLFFSPRTAKTFVTLALSLEPRPDFGAGTAYCLSAAVAALLDPLGFGQVRVAARPTEADLLALIAR